MMRRPLNHATAAPQLNGTPGADWPEVPEDLLKHLEAIYPERCYRATPGQTLEDHLQYAGAAGLVADLRGVFEEQRAAAIEADPDDASALSVEVHTEE